MTQVKKTNLNSTMQCGPCNSIGSSPIRNGRAENLTCAWSHDLVCVFDVFGSCLFLDFVSVGERCTCDEIVQFCLWRSDVPI